MDARREDSTTCYRNNVKHDPPDEPRWTKAQVSAYLQVSVGTLRKWRRRVYGPQGRLYGGTEGGALRWDPAEVRAFAADPANFPLPTS